MGRIAIRRAVALLSAAAVLDLVAPRAFAVTSAWNDGSGNWNVAGNWSPSGVPGAGATVNIVETDGVSRTITYNYNGSTVTLGSLTLDLTGGSPGGSSQLLMTGFNLSSNSEIIGASGAGTFNQSGGTNNDTGGFGLGSGSGSTGSYILTGTGSLNAASGQAIGLSGTGIFNQSGGTNTVSSGNMNVGYSSGANGSYLLSGGLVNLVSGNVFLGGNPSAAGGSGSLTVTGTGTLNTSSASSITVYNTSGSVLTLNGGTINTGSLNLSGNPSLFNWMAGTLNWTNPNINLLVDSSPFGSLGGTLNLTSGQSLSVASAESVGNTNVGTLNQGGGTNTPSVLILGASSASLGSYIMNGSSAVLNVTSTEYIGDSATGTTSGGQIIQYGGTFNQSAGTHTVALIQAIAEGGTGLYLLSGGSLTVGTTGAAFTYGQLVGSSGTGVMNQTGGTNTIGTATLNQYLLVGYGFGAPSALGTYLMNGSGSVLTVNGEEVMGVYSTGTTSGSTITQYGGIFNQSGGTHIVNGSLFLGNNLGASGEFILSGGSVSVTGPEVTGYAGAGLFIQTGGSQTIGTTLGNFDIGGLSGGVGTYTLNGSSATLTVVNGGCYVGGISTASGGTGTLNIIAGTATLDGLLQIWNSASVVNLSGGTLNVGSLNTFSNPSRFNWTGGTLNFIDGVTIDSNFALGPVTLLPGMTLSAGTGQTLTNNGTVTLAGGTLGGAGITVNNAVISGFGAMGGTGGFTNNLQLNQTGGSLTLSTTGPLSNNGSINLGAGGQLVLTGSTLNNSGTINLNSASMAGTSTLNNTGGSIVGPGAILAPLSNAGSVVVPSGTTLISQAFTNSGSIDLTVAAANLNGGTIANNGTIQGQGSVNSIVNNLSGTIESSGGTLSLNSTITNLAFGTISPGMGSEILATTGLATNAGLISLTGGIFDNGGHTLNNTGQISGYGTLRTGGLTNNGTFVLSGGVSTVNGNVTNSSGKTINIEFNPAIFTGSIVNNGTIVTTGTTVTFTGSYTGNAYISDPSTNIFQSNVTITTGGSMTGAAGDQFYFSGGQFLNEGTFVNAGSLQSSDLSTNTGTFNQSGAQAWSPAGMFNNSGGTAVFGSDAGAGGQNLTVNGLAGSLAFTTTQHLAALNISTGATVSITGGGSGHRSILFTPTLSVAGTLDLTSNDLDLQSGGSAGIASVTALVKRAYNNGAWTGTGITSSTAANDAAHLTAMGAILNTGFDTSLDGSPVAINDVLVKETYYGDANLDGKVDGSDYSRIDNGFLAHATGWFNGDFNYDGVVNGSDYTLIDNAFNTQGAQLTAEIADPTAQLAPAPTSVPEPVNTAAVIVGMTMLGRRIRLIAKRRH